MCDESVRVLAENINQPTLGPFNWLPLANHVA